MLNIYYYVSYIAYDIVTVTYIFLYYVPTLMAPIIALMTFVPKDTIEKWGDISYYIKQFIGFIAIDTIASLAFYSLITYGSNLFYNLWYVNFG